MTPMTISGQIVNGHLHHQENLAAFEGQYVAGTLTIVPKESANGKAAEPPAKEMPLEPPPTETAVTDEEFDPEPPEWLQVEKDLYFPMTVPTISLGKVSIRVEEGKPCIILPEELPDE